MKRKKTSTPSITEWFVPSLDEIGLVREKTIYKLPINFTIFLLYPYGKPYTCFFIWTNFESHSRNDTLCQEWLNLAPWFWRRGFLNVVNVFSLLAKLLSPLDKERRFPFPSPKDNLCKVCWNWPSGFGEDVYERGDRETGARRPEKTYMSFQRANNCANMHCNSGTWKRFCSADPHINSNLYTDNPAPPFPIQI